MFQTFGFAVCNQTQDGSLKMVWNNLEKKEYNCFILYKVHTRSFGVPFLLWQLRFIPTICFRLSCSAGHAVNQAFARRVIVILCITCRLPYKRCPGYYVGVQLEKYPLTLKENPLRVADLDIATLHAVNQAFPRRDCKSYFALHVGCPISVAQVIT